MFNNPRYITSGFQSTIPLATQLILFQMINNLKVVKHTDYLQVFTLSVENHEGRAVQKIVHTQEEPLVTNTYFFPLEPFVSAKVFVIDDEDHHTFLLAEEY